MTLDSEPNKVKYRAHWTPPLALDPFDQKTVYYGTQVIHKTSNGGQTWTVISPDLSTNDPTRIVSSGGIIGDNLGQFYGEVVFAIAPSKIQRGLIWAGTNDGLIWITQDGGANWTNVTKNVAGLPVWGTVRQISPSTFDAGTAYVAVDVHMMDNREPFIYKTTDFGKSWKKITGDIPAGHPLDYVMTRRREPEPEGDALRRHGPRVLLLDGRRRALDAVQGRPAGLAGDVDRSGAARARRRRLDLRPRTVAAEGHHDARAGGPGARRRAGVPLCAACGRPAGAQRSGRVPLHAEGRRSGHAGDPGCSAGPSSGP